jgi:chromosome segregation ATPase
MTQAMDNLEKLIQLATIEQMYSMLRKLKTDNSSNINECNFSDENYSPKDNTLSSYTSLLGENKHLKTELDDHSEKLRRNNGEILQLTQSIELCREKIQMLEDNLSKITNTNTNNSNITEYGENKTSPSLFTGFVEYPPLDPFGYDDRKLLDWVKHSTKPHLHGFKFHLTNQKRR